MFARVFSSAVRGIDGYPVVVELDLANGLPHYITVGLPDSAVRESRERVVSAVKNSGYGFPCRRITVNLAPAELRKRGTQFDLPVALGILAASGQIGEGEWMLRYCLLGELALDGSVKPVSGVLPMAAAARARGLAGMVLPAANAGEAAATGLPSFGVSSLQEAVSFLAGRTGLAPAPAPGASDPGGAPVPPPEDIRDVKGQSLGKRALEVAAAGGHHILFVGPPGAGKSMLARRLPGLLPPLAPDEALEAAKVLSVSGTLPQGGWVRQRPFRAPHHTITPVSLVGGGSPCRPGEISFAHKGVLFLDELAEFKRESLEALRTPLEARRVRIARLADRADYPADVLLAAAMNPCPCGWKGHPLKACSCSPLRESRYRARLSGPFLDRLDLRVEVPPLEFNKWAGSGVSGESSAQVRERVAAARRVQEGRFGAPGRTNASMGPEGLRRFCRLDSASLEFLESAALKLALSARSLDRVLKVSRTIADLRGNGKDALEKCDIIEALALSGREAPGAIGEAVQHGIRL